MLIINNLLIKYITLLKNSSPTPQLDVEVLLSFVLNKPKEFLYTHPEYRLSKKQLTKFNSLINRRLKREPVAYLTGEKEFHGLKFLVNKNVLIPRPETEILVETALREISNFQFPISKQISNSKLQIPNQITNYKLQITVIDIGAGSGCIPISIAKNLPENILNKTKIYAIDNSVKALNVAQKNAELHGVEKKIKFINNDLLKKNSKFKIQNSKFLIITANLPYISTSQYKTLSPDIKKYEPKQALRAGKDGLKYYRRLFKQIKKNWVFAKPYRVSQTFRQITLIIEINPIQVESIKKILKQDFKNFRLEVIKDLAELSRIMIIKL